MFHPRSTQVWSARHPHMAGSGVVMAAHYAMADVTTSAAAVTRTGFGAAWAPRAIATASA